MDRPPLPEAGGDDPRAGNSAPPPAVSVVVALHNAASFIADTLQSVIAQSFADWETIVVDDCSSDESPNIVRRIAESDKRIRLIGLPVNSGPAVARNTAIAAARGRYISFLDSDDLWQPAKLERQVAFMRDNDYALTCTYYEKMTASGERTGRIVAAPATLSYRDMLKSNRIGCLTAMYDSATLGKVYMPQIRKRQDYGLWLKIMRQGQIAHCLPEVLALYRMRPGSLSGNKLEMLAYNWRLYRRVERMPLLVSAYYLGWNIFRKLVE